MTITAQTKANKKWQEKNRERTRYLRNRSATRTFIRRDATYEDLEEIKSMIAEREKELAVGEYEKEGWLNIMNEEQFGIIKEKMEKAFNCEVVMKGNDEVVTEVLGNAIFFHVSKDGVVEGEALSQPELDKEGKKVVKSARRFLETTIKKVCY